MASARCQLPKQQVTTYLRINSDPTSSWNDVNLLMNLPTSIPYALRYPTSERRVIHPLAMPSIDLPFQEEINLSMNGFANHRCLPLQSPKPIQSRGGAFPGPPQQHSLIMPRQMLPRHGMIPPTHTSHGMFEQPPSLPPHDKFKMLQINRKRRKLHMDSSSPSDLFGALSREKVRPPKEEMNHLDSYQQDLGFNDYPLQLSVF